MSATSTDRRQRQPSEPHVIVYLAYLTALMAFSIDPLLPSFDEIRDHFELAEGDNSVSLIVTTYLIGMAFGQLAWGPISDRFGRGPALRTGLVVYVIGAAGATLAPSLEVLLASRLVWGLGAGAPAALRAAIARDLYGQERMARVMSVVMAIFLLAPVIGPAAGAMLVSIGSWRWAMAGPGVAVVIAVLWSFRFGETLSPDHRRPLAVRPTLRAFAAVARTTVTRRYTLGLMFASGAFFVFLSSSQPIIDEIYGRDELFVPLFSASSVVMAAAVFGGSRLIPRKGARSTAVLAIGVFVGASVLQLALAIASDGVPNLYLWFAILTLANCGATLLTPIALSLAMEPMAQIAGTASAVVGMVSAAGGAVLGAFIDARIGDAVTPMAIGYLLYGSIALFFVVRAGSASP